MLLSLFLVQAKVAKSFQKCRKELMFVYVTNLNSNYILLTCYSRQFSFISISTPLLLFIFSNCWRIKFTQGLPHIPDPSPLPHAGRHPSCKNTSTPCFPNIFLFYPPPPLSTFVRFRQCPFQPPIEADAPYILAPFY